jgi:AcrR family transcriptional regulator
LTGHLLPNDESPTKRRIIRTGARLFAEHGYEATGVQKLGEAVGLGRGALYHHIESKENLLYEISIRHVVAMVELGEALVDEPLPPDEKFRVLARRLMVMIAEHQPEVAVFFHEYRSLSKQHSAELMKIRDRFEDVWKRILDEGAEQGMLKPTHPVMVKGILGLFNYSYIWLRPGGGLAPEAIADMFCDLALDGLRT